MATSTWDAQSSCQRELPHPSSLVIDDGPDRDQELESPFYFTTNKLFGTFHSSSAATTKVV